MPKCVMLVGLPGVGKSTWIQNNRGILPPRGDTGQDPYIASSDFYIEESARLLGTTYSELFPVLIKYAEAAFNRDVETLAFNGHDFIVDRTNLSPNSRYRVMNLINKNAKEPYQFEAVVFKTPDSRTHMDRLASRHGKSIPADVMDNMKRLYRDPTNHEGFANIRFLEI